MILIVPEVPSHEKGGKPLLYPIAVFFNLSPAEPRGSANSLLGSLKIL